MRTLKFLPDSMAFELAYTALVTAQMKLNLQQMRNAARLLRKFEAVGRKKRQGDDAAAAGSIDLYVNPKACKVELEEAEFTLLRELVEAAPFLPRVARELEGLIDLLENTPEDGTKKANGKSR